jgi:hypothetical protein
MQLAKIEDGFKDLTLSITKNGEAYLLLKPSFQIRMWYRLKKNKHGALPINLHI